MMRALIVYRSKYGTTKSICEEIKSQLEERFGSEIAVSMTDTAHFSPALLKGVDLLFLGTSIYAGKPCGGMHSLHSELCLYGFCEKHAQAISMVSHLFLFVCGKDLSHASAEIAAAFPSTVRMNAVEARFIEGEFALERMNIFERLLLRFAFHVRQSEYRNCTDDVAEFLQSV